MITRSQEEILQRLIQVKAERDAEEQYSQRWMVVTENFHGL